MGDGTGRAQVHNQNMTEVFYAIVHAGLHPKKDDFPRIGKAGPLVFVSGLTDGEQEFIRQNKSHLGSGSARRTSDYVVALWELFRSLPIVVQLLFVAGMIVSIIILPYFIMYIYLANNAPESGSRMLSSLVTGIVLFIVLVTVQMLL